MQAGGVMDYGGVWSDAEGTLSSWCFGVLWFDWSSMAMLENAAGTEQEENRIHWPKDCIG